MPRHCIATGCTIVSGESYSLHEFYCDDGLCAKWTLAVKLQQVWWKGPTAGSVFCSKYFEPHSFITEGVQYCDAVGIPAKKQCKLNAIHRILPKLDGGSSQPTTPSQRPASERRKSKAVSTSYQNLMINHSILKSNVLYN